MKTIRQSEKLPEFWELNKMLYYNPKTGIIQWRFSTTRDHKWNGQRPWREAGHLHEKGYRIIGFNYGDYQAHRLAWVLHYGEWPSGIVDHIDRNKENNSISNLRIATQSQNVFNQKRSKKPNMHGFRGVSFRKNRKKYVAKIMKDGKVICLGSFNTAEEAGEKYKESSLKYFGEFSPNT
jgi:hypothetical protein